MHKVFTFETFMSVIVQCVHLFFKELSASCEGRYNQDA